MQQIRVLVADDHPVFRQGIVDALRKVAEFDVVGAAADGPGALDQIRSLHPDVAVVDVHMPNLDGVSLVGQVTGEAGSTRVLIISGDVDADLAQRALTAGAAGLLTKDARPQEICNAVLAVHRGETVLDPRVQALLADALRSRPQSAPTLLSAREHEVLRLTADGLSAPQIGERLHLGATTVKSHLQNVYGKLGVSDRAAAVAEAMRRGLLE